MIDSSEKIKDSTPLSVEGILSSIRQNEAWSNQFDAALQTDSDKPLRFIEGAISTYNQLEAASQQSIDEQIGTADQARRVKFIWVLSAPGTYFAPRKEDRYKQFGWAQFMDRRRLNHAFAIGRRITELTSGSQLRAISLRPRILLNNLAQ